MRASAAPWIRMMLRPIGVYVASRVVTVIAMAVAAVVSPEYTFGELFFRWDGGWYVHVAEAGYPHSVPMVDGQAAQSPIAFFPGYPLAIRFVEGVTGLSPKQSAILLVFVFGAAAAVLLWCLARRVADSDVADRTTALFCFFPGSFVLSLAYSKALMLAMATGCLLALVCRRWLAAGVTAALATAIRPNAVALVAACAWEAGRRLRQREWRAVTAPLLAPVGIIAFFGFLWSQTGEASSWFRTQRMAGTSKWISPARPCRTSGMWPVTRSPISTS